MKRFRKSIAPAAILSGLLWSGAAAAPVIGPPPPPPVKVEDVTQPASGPQVIFYQGRLTDTSGQPRTGNATLLVALYAAASGGSPLWSETHNLVPLTDGVFSVLLGSLTPFPASAWTDPDRYLGISVDGAAEMTPRLRVASVPFAIEANRLDGKHATDFDPAGAAAMAAAGVELELKQDDQTPPNVGSNEVAWNNLHGVPAGFADGVDNLGAGVTVHGQLSGLDANDHPQYAPNAALQTSDGNPPNLGSNRVHWDNLGGVPQPLASQRLPGSWIAPGAIDSSGLAAAGIASRNLAPKSVGGAQIIDGAVGSAQVADASLTGQDVANESLTGNDIANGSLTGIDIEDESIYSSDIANGSILGIDLAPGAVGAAQVAENSLPGSRLQDNSVGGTKIQESSIAGSRLEEAAVGTRELAPNSVTRAAIQPGAIVSADLIDAPGLTFGNWPGFVDTVGSSVGQTIKALTLLAPAPGYVVVSAGAQVYMLHDTGAASLVTLALSTQPGAVPDSTSAAISLPGTYPSELYQMPLRLQNVFPVAAAGPIAVYLNALKGSQARTPSLHDVQMQAVFIARRY